MTDFIESNDTGIRIFENRTLLVSILGFCFILLVLGRLMYLQVFSHEEYRTKSHNNRLQILTINPPRGEILDRNGQVIASNRSILSLELIPEKIEDLDATLEQLSQYIELTPKHIQTFQESAKNRFRHDAIVLKRDIPAEEQAALALNRHKWQGVRLATDVIRHYPYSDELAHALGSVRRITTEDLQNIDADKYAGMQFIGGTGVERFYEASLIGSRGHRTVEVDARGRVLEEIEDQRVPPRQGASITLHLDLDLQLVAHEALGSEVGAVVAIEPKTGGILALVSTPAYNPNEVILGLSEEQEKRIYGNVDKPLFNRATQGLYAPGSTFKPIVGLAALYREITEWDEILQDDGVFRLPNSSQVYRSWNRTATNPGGHGQVHMHRAIYRSANVYFYEMATRLEVDNLAEFSSNRFGLGRRVSYDLPEEEVGVLPSRGWKRKAMNEAWYPGDTVILGIGQGFITMSPLQLANVATILANRGLIVQPRMLKRSDQRLINIEEEPSPIYRPSESETMAENWERMALAMSDVIHRGNQGFDQNGTAWAYIGMNIPYIMAGKSGTAQVIATARDGTEVDPEELEREQRNHALFIAFAPLVDPQIAVAVIVEHGGGGSAVAAPIARQVIDSYLVPDLIASNE